MTTPRVAVFGRPGGEIELPESDLARQAIASLRGYIYQIQRALLQWVGLSGEAQLYIEVAEDFAAILPGATPAADALNATQVKDTRESGRITLNSADVKAAIAQLFELQQKNPGRSISLTFLTTSEIGREHIAPLPSKQSALALWSLVAAGAAEPDELLTALKLGFDQPSPFATYLATCSAGDLNERIIKRLVFACGEPDGEEIARKTVKVLIDRRDEVQATQTFAERAYPLLLHYLIDTTLRSKTRMVDAGDFLHQFAKATEYSLPSRVAEALVAAGSIAASPTLDETRLGKLSQALLDLARPRPMSVLFPSAAENVKKAYDAVVAAPRTITGTEGKATSKVSADELLRDSEREHIIVALPGAGKSFTLWQTAQKELDEGALFPLFLQVGYLQSVEDVCGTVRDLIPGIEPKQLFQDDRVCVFLDGWSEFATGIAAEERSKLLRLLHGRRIIAGARPQSAAYAQFKNWNLEPLQPATVEQALVLARPGEKPPTDSRLMELLRLPLAFSLFLFLPGRECTPGTLLRKMHSHFSQGLPNSFEAALSMAVAAMALSNSRSHARFLGELDRQCDRVGVADGRALLMRLGTIHETAGTAIPLHDLYWSWLAGLGILRSGIGEDALHDLKTRESIQLALDSGAITSGEQVEALAWNDVVLATDLTSAAGSADARKAVHSQLDKMFADPRLSVRVRAAIAGFHSGTSYLVERSLAVLSETGQAKYWVPALAKSLDPGPLFDCRDTIFAWCGGSQSETVLDAIADRGGSHWDSWLATVGKSGRVAPAIPVAAALSCSGVVPEWTVPHLPSLVTSCPWRLRSVAHRGLNRQLAAWLVNHYDLCVNTNSSGWLDVNQVLVKCGDPSIYEDLLTRFSGMPAKEQELVGFAVEQLGAHWIARFQRIAFSIPGTTHHHRLADATSLEIDDATARAWIENGYYKTGWRVLIARHGGSVLDELVAQLPSSFNGIGMIPALAVMRYLEDSPKSLIDEIWKRFNGTIMPAVAQDAINALVTVKTFGFASLVNFYRQQPTGLSTYHLAKILEHYQDWKARNGMEVRFNTGRDSLTFERMVIVQQLVNTTEDPFMGRLTRFDPEIVVDFVSKHPPAKLSDKVVHTLLQSVEVPYFDEALFERLLGQPELADLLLKVFSRAFSSFPASAILAILNASHIPLEKFIWRLSSVSTAAHREVHIYLVRRILSGKVDLHQLRSLAGMLVSYDRFQVNALMAEAGVGNDDSSCWLIREIEQVRQERLIDEDGHLLG